MPPEQARGEVERMDQRSDVFGLGAMLCEVLTGEPPLAGRDTARLLDQAKACDHTEAVARLDGCGADAELVRLVKDCLAAEPTCRPRDAGVVARAVTAYLEGVRERLQAVEKERAAAQARAEEAKATAAAERKARRRTAGLAVAVLLLVACGGSVAWLWQQQRLQRREAEAARRDDRLLQALLEVSGPREAPRYRMDHTGNMIEVAEPSADERLPAAFREWNPSFDVDGRPTEELAALLKGRPKEVVTEVIAALDEWASQRRHDAARRQQDSADWQSRWERVANLADALDDSGPERRELRDILRRGDLAGGGVLPDDRDNLLGLAKSADVTRQPVLGLLTLARALQVAGDEAQAERLLRRAVIERPGEILLHDALGHLLERQQPPRWGEVVACYTAARALRPGLGVALARALQMSGRADEGLAVYGQLVEQDKRNPWLHFGRGNVLLALHEYDQAEKAFGTAVDLKRDFSGAHNNRGIALLDQGRYEDAVRAFQEALDTNRNYPGARYNLGNALRRQRRFKEAEEAYRAALALRPGHPETLWQLGLTLRDQGQLAEALQELRRADALGSKGPGWQQYRPAKWIGECQRLVELDRRRPAVLRGDADLAGAPPLPTLGASALGLLGAPHGQGPLLAASALAAARAGARELMEFASVCRYKGLHVTATRYYAAAFDTADLDLLGDFAKEYRSNPLCSAALGAAGQGEDAQVLPDEVRLALRLQALQWLRANLEGYAELVGRDPRAKKAVRERLTELQHEPELTSVRENDALDQLPEEERQQWHELWDGVATLLKKVETRK
jgi:serine/threonine-protein kinase